MEEKRVHPRVFINVDVVCETSTGASFGGTAKDISIGGMFVESAQAPDFGSKLTIAVRLPGASADLKLPGVVRWSKPGGFGVQFGLLGARDTYAITNLLKHS